MKKTIDSSPLTYLLQSTEGGKTAKEKLKTFFGISKAGLDGSAERFESGQLERIETVATLLKDRFSVQPTRLRSLSKNNDALLPSSFLDTIAQRSTAVCRIARYFSIESFRNYLEENWITIFSNTSGEDLIEALHLDPQKNLVEDGPSSIRTQLYLNLRGLLTEILDIPSKVANDIFLADYVQWASSEEGKPKEIFISLLEELKNISASQLAKINPVAIGTGFLVGDSHLLTNHHVVESIDQARECVAQFNYVKDTIGTSQRRIEYKLGPDLLFVSNPKLDYTLVQLKTDILKKKPGYSFDWIQMVGNDANVLPGIDKDTRNQLREHYHLPELQEMEGDRVFIVQHPRGEHQKIGLSSDRVLNYRDDGFKGGLLDNVLRYRAASDFGSSGSPVLNAHGELVALHQAAMRREPDAGAAAEIMYQGIRICRIVEDLQRRSFENLKLKSFIQDFVLTAEELSYPALPTAFELDGSNESYIDLFRSDSPSKRFKDPEEFTLEVWVHPYFQNSDSVIFSQLYDEKWSNSVGQDAIFGQYVVALKITADRQVLFERKPFWPVSSSNFPKNGLLYPSLQPSPGRTDKRHPFEVLVIENNDATDVTIHKSIEDQDKLTALKYILCCLGLIPLKSSDVFSIEEFVEATFVTDPGNDTVLTQAIEEFNRLKPSDSPGIQEENVIIKISLETMDFFRRKGLFLGAGIKAGNNSEESQPFEFRDHFGPRIFELQNCFASLDWNYLTTECKRSSVNPDVPLHGRYDWPEEHENPESYRQHPDKTAYAAWKLQRSDFQSGRPIFGALCLAALEKAKSYEVLTSKKLPIGQFSHIAVVYDGDTQEVYIYINGQVACRRYIGRPSQGYIKRTVIGASPIETSSRKAQLSPEALKENFQGAISEFRLWKRKLSCKDLSSRMHSRLRYKEVAADLIGYCRPEENIVFMTSPTTLKRVTPSSAQSKQFKLLNSRLFPAPPIAIGLQISDVIPLYISPEDTVQANALLTETSGLTVELWVKPQCGKGTILKGRDTSGKTYSLSWDNGKIRIVFEFDSLIAIVETQTLSPYAKTWHHIAFSWDIDSKEICVYVDGKLKRLEAIAAQVESIRYQSEHRPFVKLLADGFDAIRQAIEILPNYDDPKAKKIENPSSFCVLLTEVRVWNLARSHDEIIAGLNQRLCQNPNSNRGLVGYWRFDDLSDFSDLSMTHESKLFFPTSQVRKLHFLDLQNDHEWATEMLKVLYSIGLFSSFLTDNCSADSVLFRPDEPMKRQELAGLLINAFGGVFNEQRAGMIAAFQDVVDSRYLSDIEYAWKLGMMSGQAENNAATDGDSASFSNSAFVREITFNPSQPLNRGNVAVSLLAALRSHKGDSRRLTDERCAELLGPYAIWTADKPFLKWIHPKKIAKLLELKIIVSQAPRQEITDFDEFLAGKATRLEIAVMLYQTLTYLNDTLKLFEDEKHVL